MQFHVEMKQFLKPIKYILADVAFKDPFLMILISDKLDIIRYPKRLGIFADLIHWKTKWNK